MLVWIGCGGHLELDLVKNLGLGVIVTTLLEATGILIMARMEMSN